MGAFEFDRKADIGARNCLCGGSGGSGGNSGSEACIIAQKIFDQCRIQKCLSSDILGPARASRNGLPGCNDMLCEGDIIIPPCNAADVTIRDLTLDRIELMRKRPNPLQEGCWDLELKYVFEYVLEFRRADGCFIGAINATNMYNLRVTLFGSTEADVTSVTDLYDCCGNSNGGPFVLAEGKAIALQAELRYPSCNPCSCDCDCGCGSSGDMTLGAPIAVNVTIGLFTIVKLFRTVNMVVHCFGRCMPENCANFSTTADPCANFEAIRFPMDLFSPSTEPKSCCGFGTVFGSPHCVEPGNNHDCGCGTSGTGGCNCSGNGNCSCNCNANAGSNANTNTSNPCR